MNAKTHVSAILFIEETRATNLYQTESENCLGTQRNDATYQTIGPGHPRVKGEIFEAGIEDNGLLVHVVIEKSGTCYRSGYADGHGETLPSRCRQLIVSRGLNGRYGFDQSVSEAIFAKPLTRWKM